MLLHQQKMIDQQNSLVNQITSKPTNNDQSLWMTWTPINANDPNHSIYAKNAGNPNWGVPS